MGFHNQWLCHAPGWALNSVAKLWENKLLLCSLGRQFFLFCLSYINLNYRINHPKWNKVPVSCQVRSDASPSVQSRKTKTIIVIRHLYIRSIWRTSKHLTFIVAITIRYIITININITVIKTIKDQTCKSIVRLHPCSPMTVTGPPWAEEWRTWVWAMTSDLDP